MLSVLPNLFGFIMQPEVSIRYYRRLLQMGVNNTELWNNLGLCCFYASQYDMALNCFERALSLASDDNMADVWYEYEKECVYLLISVKPIVHAFFVLLLV